MRLTFTTRVRSELQSDADELEREGARAAAALQMESRFMDGLEARFMDGIEGVMDGGGLFFFPATGVFTDFSPPSSGAMLGRGLRLSIEFYGQDDDAPSTTTTIPLLPTWQTLRDHADLDLRRDVRESRLQIARRNAFTLIDRHVQSLLEEQLRDFTFGEVAFAGFSGRAPGIERIGRSRRVPLDRRENRNVRDIDVGNGSRVRMETQAGDSEIIDLTWDVPDEFLTAGSH